MPAIPHGDELFRRYFAPWYTDEDLAARDFDATRPDLVQFPARAGAAASTLSRLRTCDQRRYIRQLAVAMTDAAVADLSGMLELSPPVDFDWWETSLWHPPTGHLIPPTHWAIRKLSADAWEDGLVAKIHCAADVLRQATHDTRPWGELESPMPPPRQPARLCLDGRLNSGTGNSGDLMASGQNRRHRRRFPMAVPPQIRPFGILRNPLSKSAAICFPPSAR